MSARAIEPAANNATPTDATSPAPRSFDIDIVLLLIFLCFPRTTWRSLSCDKHRCVPIAIKRTEPALARQQGKSGSGRPCGRRRRHACAFLDVLEICTRPYRRGRNDSTSYWWHTLEAQRQANNHERTRLVGR